MWVRLGKGAWFGEIPNHQVVPQVSHFWSFFHGSPYDVGKLR